MLTVDFRRAARRLGPMRRILLFLMGTVLLATLGRAAAASAFSNLGDWVIEQMPGGTVAAKDGALIIDDAGGCTVWYRLAVTSPVEIRYDVLVVARGGPHDRVSDVNCFWMANDPKSPDGCPFAIGHGRSGKFTDYDSLQTYYVGMGGNMNSTTRFRRYDGQGAKPLLRQYDLRAAQYRLQPNTTYHVRIVAQNGVTEYWRDGVKFFSFADPAPLTRGWFAFRTLKSHLEIRNFEVTKPATKS